MIPPPVPACRRQAAKEQIGQRRFNQVQGMTGTIAAFVTAVLEGSVMNRREAQVGG